MLAVITQNVEMWSLVVGSFLPLLVAVVQQPRFPNWFRAVIGVASSAVAAGVTLWLTGGSIDLDGDFVGSFLRVLIASQATYVAFWKPTIAPAIEKATLLK